MSDTEQGDIALETQQDSKGQFVSEDKADKGGKKIAVLFSAENEQN